MKTILINVQTRCPIHGTYSGDSCFKCEVDYFKAYKKEEHQNWDTERLLNMIKKLFPVREPAWFYEI